MNTVYTSKWNVALGTWVACSEITRRAGKTAATVMAGTLMAATPAWAIVCAPTASGSYVAGWTAAPFPTNCNQVPATVVSPTVLGSDASFYLVVRSALTAPNDVVTVGNTDISYNGAKSFAPVIGNQYLTHGSIDFTNVKATIRNNGEEGGIVGLGTHNTVPLSGNNFDLTSNSHYTEGNSSGAVGSYAILAGSSVSSSEQNIDNNGLFSTIMLEGDATINQTTSGGKVQPVLNSGLRAIQGAVVNVANPGGRGSSGKIEIKGHLMMTLTGERIEGIYVSGAGANAANNNGEEAVSQAILNDSTIQLVKSGSGNYDSSAIKIGKTRAVGTGKGLVVSNGALSIEMDPNFGGAEPYMSPAIKLAVSGSQLLANGPDSSATINASRSALAIGIDDWGSNADSTGIQAQLGRATVSTQSATAPLLLVDRGQTNAEILFDNASDLTAAADGYLIDIIEYRDSPIASSVTFTLDNGSVAKGLSYQTDEDSTLNVELNRASSWNLVEKDNGDLTSRYSQLTMQADSTLNAFKSGAAAFVMDGPVHSDASTMNLVDGQPDDVLTIQPRYEGQNNAVLAVDTCLGESGAASDVLRVFGDTSGTTVLQVSPFDGVACQGANTTTTGDGKGILVVEVTGNSDAVFSLSGPLIRGGYSYQLVQEDKNWYLRSQASTPAAGSVVVSKTVNATPAWSGAIDFTLTCTNPALTQQGTITVSNNQGQASPITVEAGSNCQVSEVLPPLPATQRWDTPVYTQPAAVVAGQATTASIVNTLHATGTGGDDRTVMPVPVNTPLALGALAAVLGLLGGRRFGRRGPHARR